MFLAFAIAMVGVVAASTLVIGIAVGLAGPAASQDRAAIARIVGSPAVLIGSAAASSSVLALLALGAAGLSPTPWLQRLTVLRPRASTAAWIALVVGAPAVGQALDSLAALSGLERSPVLERLDAMIRGASGFEVPLLVLAVGIGPGLGEELMFRGYVQTRLVERWGTWAGISLASILFGVMHLDLMHGALAAAMGVYLGFVAHRCGSIVPSMVAHAFNNTTSIFLTRSLGDVNDLGPTWLVAAVSVVIASGCVAAFVRTTRGVGFIGNASVRLHG